MRIGLTGGIASGKSLVADLFGELGADVIDTDTLARDVAEPGQPALQEIIARFGDSVRNTDGGLNRRALRALVFADDRARHDLEAILHPRIRAEVNKRVDASQAPYQLIVVPLLAETGYQDFVERVVVVDCPEATQLERLMQRDGETEDSARRILNAQADREERLSLADDVIDNSGSREETARQVRRLHRNYLEATHPG